MNKLDEGRRSNGGNREKDDQWNAENRCDVKYHVDEHEKLRQGAVTGKKPAYISSCMEVELCFFIINMFTFALHDSHQV